MDHACRLARLAAALDRPLLVSSLVNIRYLTGFTGTAATMVVTPDRSVFLTDGRYAERAAELVGPLGVDLVVHGPDLVADIAATLAGEPELLAEAEHVTWAFADKLAAALPQRVTASTGAVERLRRIKQPAEVEALRCAAAAGDAAFASIAELAAAAHVESELGEALIDAMRRSGGQTAGWPPIVAVGANAARPHHRSGSGSVGEGLLLVDYGCVVDGYHSDMTRTVWLGGGADPEVEAVHDAVLAANEAGIAAVAPGVPARDVDEACRLVLRTRGHEEAFLHSTGHGVGLEIHEAPWLRRTSEDVLEPGDVVTVEPGVYLPGRFGVRIEDMVLVTEHGREVLTKSDKALRPGGGAG